MTNTELIQYATLLNSVIANKELLIAGGKSEVAKQLNVVLAALKSRA